MAVEPFLSQRFPLRIAMTTGVNAESAIFSAMCDSSGEERGEKSGGDGGLSASLEEVAVTGPMETEAADYLRRHRIPQLLENLTASLVYHRPEDPRQFMRDHVQQLLKAKTEPSAHQPPALLDESNAKSVFGMLDLAGKGSVTRQQYLEAMASLGVSDFSRDPPGASIDKITRETFVMEATSALGEAAATYLED